LVETEGYRIPGMDAALPARPTIAGRVEDFYARPAKWLFLNGRSAAMLRQMTGQLVRALIFTAVYYLVQQSAFLLRVEPIHRSMFFAPIGVLLTTLLLLPGREWWLILVMFGLVQIPVFMSDGIAGITRALVAYPSFCITGVFTAWLIRRIDPAVPFQRLKSFL